MAEQNSDAQPVITDPVADLGLYVAHVGINAANEDEAEAIAADFDRTMGLPRRTPAPISVFSGTLIETMCGGGRGECGHIGFHVDDMEAAEAYFRGRGATFDESSRQLLPDGSTKLVYFTEPIGGFAIHLTID